MDWDRLKVFYSVAGAGSFTAAGRQLGMSQSAASRQIRALEDELDVVLFRRHARGIVLTKEGKDLFTTAENVMRNIDETERRLRESRARPAGLLRVNTLVTFGAVWLSRHLTPFMEAYPEVDVQLILSDDWVDLSAGAADVAIRLGNLGPTDLIQQPLATFHAHVYASSGYLARRGTPTQPNDLLRHDIISFKTGGGPLRSLDLLGDLVGAKVDLHARLEVNNLSGVLHAVEAGLGLAVLPDYLVHEHRSLVRLFPDQTGTSYDSFFCYPQELRGSPTVLVFRDFLRRQVRAAANTL